MKYILVFSVVLALLQATHCNYSSVKLDAVEAWFDDFTTTNADDITSASALAYFQASNTSSTPSVFWKINGKCYDIDGNEWSQTPTASAVFRLASVTKLFTATATMQLYEKGLFAMDDPIVQYIPWLATVANDERINQVRIIHLLTHAIGVDNRIINSFSEVGAQIDIESFVRNNWQPFVRTPGTVIAYSNMALILQGLLIQTLSETNYVDYMHTNVFDPLGMTSAKFMHEFNGNYEPICFPAYAKANSYEPYGISGIASGDLAISLEDMVKFLNAHLNNGSGLFQSPATAALMHTPTFHAGLFPGIFGGLALQFYTETYRGQRALTHAGALLEFSTMAAIYPDTMEGLFAVQTTTLPLAGGFVYESYKSFLDEFYGQSSAEVTFPEATPDNSKLEKLYGKAFGSTQRVQLGASKFFTFMSSSSFQPSEDGLGVIYARNGKQSTYYPITLPASSTVQSTEYVLQRDPAQTNQTEFLIVTFDKDGNLKYVESWPSNGGEEETFGDDMVTNLVLFAFDGFSSVLFIAVCIAKIAKLGATKCEQFEIAKKNSPANYKTVVFFMVIYFLTAALCVGAIVSEVMSLEGEIQLYIGVRGEVVAFNVFILVKLILILFLGLCFPLLVITKKIHFELWERIMYLLIVLIQIVDPTRTYINRVLCYSATAFHYLSYVEWRHKSVDPVKEELVLCVHGLTRNARDFDMVAVKLVTANANLRVVSVDMPGRGYSDWLKTPAEYNYLQYCADLTTLLASLGFESCYWVGTSMGGLIGMTMASSENSPIKKLFLNDVGPLIPASALSKIGSYVGNNPLFKDRKEAESYFKNIHPGFGVKDHEWDHFVQHSTRPVDGTSDSRLHYDPAIALPFKTDATQPIAFWPFWDKIKCPVFVLRGETSEILTNETVEEMKKRGPGLAKFIELKELGHAPHLFSNDTVDPIVEFILGHN